MKIAVATNDQVRVTGHIGKCRGFKIYEIEGKKIIDTEYRENLFTNHRLHGHIHEHHNGDGGHSHANLIEGLKDCEYLISKGGGWRVVEDLKQHNINTLFADEEMIADAVNKFIEGELKNDDNLICNHSEEKTLE